MIIGPLLVSATLVARQPRAQPQPRPRRAYAQGALLFSRHPAAAATYHRVDPNLSGHTWVVSGAAGGFLNRSVALEGELAYGGFVSAGQHFGYFTSEDYIAQNRDVLLNGIVRYRPGGRGVVELVAGGGYARTTARQVSTIAYAFDQIRRPVPDRETTLHSVTWTAGLDAVLPAGSPHVAIAPSFRFRWVHRPEPAGAGWNGIGWYALQFGVGVRVQ
jgi:hypothetical protein